jgi:uncharacterized protein DUF3306
MTDENFLSRWSRRKTAAKAATPAPRSPQEDAKPVATPAMTPETPAAPQPLPPVESLTFDSDFTAFMKPEVEPGLRREALKTLLRDPRFNVMDGLDVYIDDYSKPDPLPDGWLEKLNMVKRLGIFIEPREDAPREPAEGAQPAAPAAPAAVENALEEHPLDGPSADPQLDTLRDANPPSGVGKS